MSYDNIYMNKKMEKYLSNIKNNSNSLSVTPLLNQKISSIIKNVSSIGQTVIFDEDGLNESDIDWGRILKFTNNFTGYEVGCNEFSIPIEDVENVSLPSLAAVVLDKLKSKFKDRIFVVYFIVCSESLEFRFHVFREEDGFWINYLDGIEQPLLYVKG